MYSKTAASSAVRRIERMYPEPHACEREGGGPVRRGTVGARVRWGRGVQWGEGAVGRRGGRGGLTWKKPTCEREGGGR